MFHAHAIRFIQNGRVFYLAAFHAEDLVKMTEVAVWSSTRERRGATKEPPVRFEPRRSRSMRSSRTRSCLSAAC